MSKDIVCCSRMSWLEVSKNAIWWTLLARCWSTVFQNESPLLMLFIIRSLVLFMLRKCCCTAVSCILRSKWHMLNDDLTVLFSVISAMLVICKFQLVPSRWLFECEFFCHNSSLAYCSTVRTLTLEILRLHVYCNDLYCNKSDMLML